MMEETLGTGTPVGAGEDPYLFYRVVQAGHTLVYEPEAFVWHQHRQDLRALGQQTYRYSKSAAAYHLTTWILMAIAARSKRCSGPCPCTTSPPHFLSSRAAGLPAVSGLVGCGGLLCGPLESVVLPSSGASARAECALCARRGEGGFEARIHILNSRERFYDQTQPSD
ncbi:MAG: hypothetical protein HC857_15590 [Synechococcales cyanobacterium RU_4_20]|nr:hypothetical protein [Synechococcales cyanobacterium RU_4_20]